MPDVECRTLEPIPERGPDRPEAGPPLIREEPDFVGKVLRQPIDFAANHGNYSPLFSVVSAHRSPAIEELWP